MAQKVMSRAIVVDLDRCLACKACEMACAKVHAGVEDVVEAILSDTLLVPRVRVRSVEGRPVPVQCQHCEEPVCVAVCSSEALYRDEERGRVLTAPEKCPGCQAGIRACPYGAVFWSEPLQVAVKCDLCEGIIEEGQEPTCIAACPTRCRHILDVEEGVERNYESVLRQAKGTVTYTIDAENCICCSRCARECPVDCIEGKAGKAPAEATEEDKQKGKVGTPFAIDQDACVHCGNCFEVCPVDAVERT